MGDTGLRSGEWSRWLTQGWTFIGLPLLALLAFSYARFRWRLRDRTEIADGALPRFLRRLEARGTSYWQPVRLTQSPRIGVPLARGLRYGEICLPPETLERFPVERQEIVVAHELAHLRRRDPLWFGLTRIVERALFFQPLNSLARRQLQEISEFRCDDWAVAMTRRPISLAKCLTEVAEWSLRGRATVPVPTMSSGKTRLSRRVSRLLKRNYPMPSEETPRWLVPASLALLFVIVLIAPSISAHPSPQRVIEVHPEAPAPPVPPAPPEVPAAPAPPEALPRPPMPATPADFSIAIDPALAAENTRLAEISERLSQTAVPSAEQLALLEARAREMAEHRESLRRLRELESEEMLRAHEEMRRSLEERRELLERARWEREESLRELHREHRERVRQEMLRAREELREQLQRLDEELRRQEREDGMK